MNKKIVSLVTLITFAIFTWSCSFKIKQVEVETIQKKGTEKINVVGVLKKNKEEIQFDEVSPILIKDGAITGETVSPGGDKKPVSIPLSEVSMFLVKQVDEEKVWLPIEKVQKKTVGKLKIVGILKKTGEKIDFVKKSPVLIIDDTIIGEAVSYQGAKESVSIPISEVSKVLVKKAKVKVGIILLVSIPVVVVALFLIIPHINTSD